MGIRGVVVQTAKPDGEDQQDDSTRHCLSGPASQPAVVSHGLPRTQRRANTAPLVPGSIICQEPAEILTLRGTDPTHALLIFGRAGPSAVAPPHGPRQTDHQPPSLRRIPASARPQGRPPPARDFSRALIATTSLPRCG